MAESTKSVVEQALQLPVRERAKLAEQLLESLEPPSESAASAWRTEVESRLAAYKAGDMKVATVSEVFGNYEHE